jgi:hypothetical protein
VLLVVVMCMQLTAFYTNLMFIELSSELVCVVMHNRAGRVIAKGGFVALPFLFLSIEYVLMIISIFFTPHIQHILLKAGKRDIFYYFILSLYHSAVS